MATGDQLEIIKASGEVEFYDLDPSRGITNIGRDPENDIVIDSPGVAPFHAMLDHRQKPYRLMVLSQTANTTLGGQPLLPDVSREIHHWDTIELDGHSIILLEGSAAATGATHTTAPATAPQPVPGQPSPPTTDLTAAPAPPPASTVPVPAAVGATAAPTRRRSAGPPTFRQPLGLPTLPPDQPDEIIVTGLSDEREWSVGVEQTAALQMTIANGGAIVAMFDVWVDGLDPDWVTISPPQVNLNEGEQTTVNITITPPRQTTSRAGAHPFAVVVTSPNYPGRHSQRGATLTINPYYEFAVGELSPKQQTVSWSKRTGKTTLPITNKGNSNTLFRLEGTDEERACSFEFQVPGETASLATQAEMRLSPEETADVPVQITPHSRRLIGLRKRIHSFTITTIPLEAGQTPRTVLGQLKDAPLIGFWHLLLISLLLVMGTVYFFMPGPNPRLWREEGAQAEATDEEIILNYNTSRFMSLGPNHILNRINALSLKLKLERKGIGEPDNTYEIVQAPLPDRPSGASKDDPQWDAVYRLTVENWLSMLYQPLAQYAEYKVFVKPVRPEIQVLAIPNTVELGQPVTLSWKQKYAERLELTQKELEGLVIEAFDSPEEVGTYELKPEDDATYVLKAYNLYTGNEDPETANATVKVVIPTPVIKLFVAQPGEVVGGTPVALNWLVTGADSVSLESDDPLDRPMSVPPEEGSINKQPMRNTRFTLRAVREVSAARTATAVATQYVTVLPTPSPPTINYFVADPEKLVRGDNSSVKLKWSIIGDVTNIEISGPSLDSPITNLTDKEGSVNVTVKDSTLFVLTAYNQTQKVSASTQVQVVDPTPTPTPTATPIPAPVINYFEARDEHGDSPPLVSISSDPKRIVYRVTANSKLTLRWKVVNDPSNVTVRGPNDDEFPNRDAIEENFNSDPYLDDITENGTFRLRAENDSGNDVYFLEIWVGEEMPPPAPQNFTYNGSGNFTWSYDYPDQLDGVGGDDIEGFRIYRAPHHLVETRSTLPPYSWTLPAVDCVDGTYYIVAYYVDEYLEENRETDSAEDSWQVSCDY